VRVRGVDLAAVEQGAHGGRHGDLPGLAARLVDARIERLDRALDGFERERARHQRGTEHVFRAE